MPRKDKEKPENYNPLVSISASVGGICVAIVAIFLIFAKEQALFLVPIVVSLAVMGMVLGHYAQRKI